MQSFKEEWFPLYVQFLHITRTVPSSVDDFENRLKKGKSVIEGNNAVACKYMAEWRKDERYNSLWPILDNYMEKDDCLLFFLDPINYPHPERVHISWITICTPEIVKKLINRKEYSDKLKNYISESRINPQDRRVLMSVF